MSDSSKKVPSSEGEEIPRRSSDLDSIRRARRAERQREQDARAREEAQREETRAEREPLKFAIMEGPLPERAVGIVLRDPTGPIKRLIVFSKASISDIGIQIARNALLEDQYAIPWTLEPRMLLVWPDQRVRAGNIWKQMRYRGMETAARGDAAAFLAAPRGEILQIPGIGKIQIVEAEK